jgi:hypothetical protein
MSGREVLGAALIILAVVITETWRPLRTKLELGRARREHPG